MNKKLIVPLLTAAFGTLVIIGSTRSQDVKPPIAGANDHETMVILPAAMPPAQAAADPFNIPPPTFVNTQPLFATGRTNYGGRTPAGNSEVDQIMSRLREADELHKPGITKELETAVATEFDEDIKRRDAELTMLEERVAKLRAQLERRRKAKAEITQLQTKVLVNDADGLGFSNAWSAGADDPQIYPNTGTTQYFRSRGAPANRLPTPGGTPAVPSATQNFPR
jgi:hypothetical protein